MQESIITLEERPVTKNVLRLFQGSIFNDSTSAILARAEEAARNKHFETALEGYNALLIREPKNFRFILDRTIVYLNCKDHDMNVVISTLENLFYLSNSANNSLRAKHHYVQAFVHNRQGKIPNALLRINLALELDDHNASYYLFRAQMHLALNNKKLSVADCHKVIELDPTIIESYQLLCSIFVDESQFKQARKILDDAEKIFSEHQDIQELRKHIEEKYVQDRSHISSCCAIA